MRRALQAAGASKCRICAACCAACGLQQLAATGQLSVPAAVCAFLRCYHRVPGPWGGSSDALGCRTRQTPEAPRPPAPSSRARSSSTLPGARPGRGSGGRPRSRWRRACRASTRTPAGPRPPSASMVRRWDRSGPDAANSQAPREPFEHRRPPAAACRTRPLRRWRQPGRAGAAPARLPPGASLQRASRRAGCGGRSGSGASGPARPGVPSKWRPVAQSGGSGAPLNPAAMHCAQHADDALLGL